MAAQTHLHGVAFELLQPAAVQAMRDCLLSGDVVDYENMVCAISSTIRLEETAVTSMKAAAVICV